MILLEICILHHNTIMYASISPHFGYMTINETTTYLCICKEPQPFLFVTSDPFLSNIGSPKRDAQREDWPLRQASHTVEEPRQSLSLLTSERSGLRADGVACPSLPPLIEETRLDRPIATVTTDPASRETYGHGCPAVRGTLLLI